MKRLWRCLLCLCAVHVPVTAHVLDQYLQVTQIALAPDGVRVELRLIPGVEVAERIGALIDANHDGQIATAEEQAYARRVQQDIELAVNGVPTPLALREMQFPTLQEMRDGVGTIRLMLMATATLKAGNQQQVYFRNNHLPELGTYLVNALLPTTEAIKISGQERDPLQRELRLAYQVSANNAQKSWRGTAILLFCVCLILWPFLHHFLRRASRTQISSG